MVPCLCNTLGRGHSVQSTVGGYHDCLWEAIRSTSEDIQQSTLFRTTYFCSLSILSNPRVIRIAPHGIMAGNQFTERLQCTPYSPPIYSVRPSNVLRTAPQCTAHTLYWMVLVGLLEFWVYSVHPNFESWSARYIF